MPLLTMILVIQELVIPLLLDSHSRQIGKLEFNKFPKGFTVGISEGYGFNKCVLYSVCHRLTLKVAVDMLNI